MAEYRRKQGSDTWHWCGNCRHYPKSDYTTHPGGTPTSGEKCDECKAKKKNNNCT